MERVILLCSRWELPGKHRPNNRQRFFKPCGGSAATRELTGFLFFKSDVVETCQRPQMPPNSSSAKQLRVTIGERPEQKLTLYGREQYGSVQGFKATTAGRNTVAKCSPKVESTLPRRPILQEYSTRFTIAVIGKDFRDGSNPVKQVGKAQRTNLPFSFKQKPKPVSKYV